MSDILLTVQLRPAQAKDAWHIRWLVWQSRINPFGLHWQRFMIASAPDEQVIGCGQVKTHADGVQELASIAVKPAWRHRQVASAIIERLLEEHPGTLYLMCRSQLGPFYHRFNFLAIEEAQMPPYFRRISRLVRWLNRFRSDRAGLLVMRRSNSGAAPL